MGSRNREYSLPILLRFSLHSTSATAVKETPKLSESLITYASLTESSNVPVITYTCLNEVPLSA